MMSFYLPKGHKLDDLLNLSLSEQIFYRITMERYIENEKRNYSQLLGEGK